MLTPENGFVKGNIGWYWLKDKHTETPAKYEKEAFAATQHIVLLFAM
jgi:hypothetical protein